MIKKIYIKRDVDFFIQALHNFSLPFLSIFMGSYLPGIEGIDFFLFYEFTFFYTLGTNTNLCNLFRWKEITYAGKSGGMTKWIILIAFPKIDPFAIRITTQKFIFSRDQDKCLH